MIWTLKSSLIVLATTIIDFDPEFMEVIASYFAVGGKYAMVIALLSMLTTMLIKAFKGKEKFI